MKIGNKLRGFRVEKGLTTVAMAEQLGVSEPTYRRYENDKSFPDIAMVDKIAKVLEKNFLDLLPEGIIFTNNEQKGGVALAYYSTINEQYEKLIAEKDIRISEKEEIIKELKETITELKQIINKFNK